MAHRTFDFICASVALVLLAPLLGIAAVAIAVSSRGPILYRARRVGQFGRPFTMYKLRTMHVRLRAGSSITAADDPRVFAAGRLLRALKIDELPQLVNILFGQMSVVGPRPEAPDIVEAHYTEEYRRTLEVKPGLTSPGSVFYYRHGERLLQDGSAEQDYVRNLLPLKMQQDLNWLTHRSFRADMHVILQTAAALLDKLRPSQAQPTQAVDGSVAERAADPQEGDSLRDAA